MSSGESLRKGKATTIALLMVAILIASAFAVVIPRARPAEAQQLTRAERNWEYINHNELGTNYNPQTQINPDNVQFLEMKWLWTKPIDRSLVHRSAVEGSITPPLVVDGIVYFATNQPTIYALDAATGELIWTNFLEIEFDLEEGANPFLPSFTPHIHGLNYYRDKGWVIPSTYRCHLTAFDALSGEVAMEIEPDELCGTYEEMREWGNRGYYYRRGSHPPIIDGDLMILPIMSRTQWGGRAYVTAFDISDTENPRRVWQTFMSPPTGVGGTTVDPDWDLRECDKGWFFSEPHWIRDESIQALSCQEVAQQCPECLKDDWISAYDDPRYPTLRFEAGEVIEPSLAGQVHARSGVSQVWGHYAMDPETRIVVMALGEAGWYPNATYRPGPNLYANNIVALDADTGEFIWWFAPVIHDLWDWDCAWNVVIGEIGDRKVVFKSCKDGFLRALDLMDGEPIWTMDLAANEGNRIGNRCREITEPAQPGEGFSQWDVCTMIDPTNLEEVRTRAWPNYPSTDSILQWPGYAGALEADIAYDGDTIYAGSMHSYSCIRYSDWEGNREPISEGCPGYTSLQHNTTIKAINADTGDIKWSFFIDDLRYRGGTSVCGDLVLAYTADGKFRILHADTGELLFERLFGNIGMQPTCGATADGEMRIFLQTAGGQGGEQRSPGVLFALGLPDELPDLVSQREIEQLEGQLDVAKIERDVARSELDDARAAAEAAAVVISPISYVIIGVGVVLVVVAGVIFARRRST